MCAQGVDHKLKTSGRRFPNSVFMSRKNCYKPVAICSSFNNIIYSSWCSRCISCPREESKIVVIYSAPLTRLNNSAKTVCSVNTFYLYRPIATKRNLRTAEGKHYNLHHLLSCLFIRGKKLYLQLLINSCTVLE